MKRTLLVVDDIRGNRAILIKILGDEYQLLEAANGEEALAILVEHHLDISAVLLDLIMPIKDGYEVLTEMRADPRLSQIPVIVTTGSTESGAEVKALSLGANDYITKPYGSDIIRHRIYNTIRLRETSALANAAERDDLTELYNRTAFFAYAAERIALQPPGYYVLSSFDINSFKVVNDQYGTDIGDLVLKHVATTFRDGFSPLEGICSRISADDFAVLYPTKYINTPSVEETRRLASIQPFNDELRVSFSIGRYVINDLSLSVSSMYDRAVLARVTVSGKFDTYVADYNEGMRDRLIAEQAIVNEMSAALDGNMFEVWLQPQYNLSNDSLVGAEALVRWRKPDGTLIPPGLFVPVFERNGFIYNVDKFVWEKTCQLLRGWLDADKNPLPVSVNISRYDLFKSDFFETLTGLIQKYRLPCSLLRLEITESAFASDTAYIVSMVEKLITYGFTVEIDDFGNGYSSLNTLKDVSASILKLDMRFLEKTANTGRGGNVLRSIVHMARWLGMSIIAEGVETREQANFLRSIGCHYVQGYLYAKPMPIRDYESHAAICAKEERLDTLKMVETMDIDRFWDPVSMETLIFNTYVGGAMIFDYSDGVPELLRISDSFLQELRIEDYPGDAADADPFAMLNELMSKDLLRIAERIVTEGGLQNELIHFKPVKGILNAPQTLRCSFREIARTSGSHLIYATVNNISELAEREEQLRFLNTVSRELLTRSNAEEGIEYALEKLVDYFEGSSVCLFEFDIAKQTAHIGYEICRGNASPLELSEPDIGLRHIHDWLRSLETKGYYIVSNVAAFDDSRAPERDFLQKNNINSLFAVPLLRDGMMIGMLCVNDPGKTLSGLEQLLALADYFSVMLTRRDLNARMREDSNDLKNMLQDMPGGYVKIFSSQEKRIPIFVNDEFCRMSNMTREQIQKFYGEDIFAGVHSDDLDRVKQTITEALAKGETVSVPMRLVNGKGGYYGVRVFYRATHEPNGDLYINAYFTPDEKALPDGTETK